MEMQGPYLEVQDSNGSRKIPLGDDPLTIGRHSDNRLVLTDTLSSRFHCHISKTANGTFLLRDLNSSNGTALNGRLVKFSQLMAGDTVSVGHTRMLFVDPNGTPRSRVPSEIDVVELGRADPLPAAEPIAPPAAKPPPADPPPKPARTAPEAPRAEMLTDDDIVDESKEIIDVASMEVVDEPETEAAPIPLDDFSEPEQGGIPLEESRFIEEETIPVIDDDVIRMEDDDVLPELVEARDAREIVETLVHSLPDQSFGETDVALVSARGQLVHPAGSPQPGANREAVDWLRLLLLLCSRSRATDVHFEPKGGDYLLRMRVDGTMVEVCRLPNAMGIRLSALVKVLSEIDIAQKNSIQEGHFNSLVPRGRRSEQSRIDYRVSFAPSVFGQKLVIRVLDTSYAPLTVRSLQLPTWMCNEVERVIRQDSGMVLVCGPTGSGKTTTLYALIRGSGIAERNVVTIEDPVEIQIEGVTQIPVDETHEKSFSHLLRSTLRQDPDVILIGEIRDAETARIAMQAAITGHLVFSTVHSQNTTGTIFRLLDLGAEPYLVAQALHLVLAQRLVRQICPHCKAAVTPTPDQLKTMGEAGTGVKRIYEPRGCLRCLNTGFSGRRAIFELLSATDELRDLITRTPTAAQIHAALASTPFKRLQHSGYQLVAQGVASFDEVNRVVGSEGR